MGRAFNVCKVRLRHQSNFQLWLGTGKQISLSCLLCSLCVEVLCGSEARWRPRTREPRPLLSQSHQDTQHLARRWHRSTKHHLELGEAMMMHGVFEVFFSPSESVYSGQCPVAIPRFGMSVALKQRAMCHFGHDVLAITLLSVCLLCTLPPSAKSIKCTTAHTNWGKKTSVWWRERMFCVVSLRPSHFFFI